MCIGGEEASLSGREFRLAAVITLPQSLNVRMTLPLCLFGTSAGGHNQPKELGDAKQLGLNGPSLHLILGIPKSELFCLSMRIDWCATMGERVTWPRESRGSQSCPQIPCWAEDGHRCTKDKQGLCQEDEAAERKTKASPNDGEELRHGAGRKHSPGKAEKMQGCKPYVSAPCFSTRSLLGAWWSWLW